MPTRGEPRDGMARYDTLIEQKVFILDSIH
jgi:hypothetical protein